MDKDFSIFTQTVVPIKKLLQALADEEPCECISIDPTMPTKAIT